MSHCGLIPVTTTLFVFTRVSPLVAVVLAPSASTYLVSKFKIDLLFLKKYSYIKSIFIKTNECIREISVSLLLNACGYCNDLGDWWVTINVLFHPVNDVTEIT